MRRTALARILAIATAVGALTTGCEAGRQEPAPPGYWIKMKCAQPRYWHLSECVEVNDGAQESGELRQ